jgi:hypothetical protein
MPILPHGGLLASWHQHLALSKNGKLASLKVGPPRLLDFHFLFVFRAIGSLGGSRGSGDFRAKLGQYVGRYWPQRAAGFEEKHHFLWPEAVQCGLRGGSNPYPFMCPIQWLSFTQKRNANGKKQPFTYVYELCHTHISMATDKTGMEKDMGYKRNRSCGDVATILKQTAKCFSMSRYPNQFLKLSSRLIQNYQRSLWSR